MTQDKIKRAVKYILKKMECSYKTTENGDLIFDYRDEPFAISFNKEGEPFISIIKFNLLTVKMDNVNEVSRLYRAINDTNSNGPITVFYDIDNDEREIDVYAHTTTLFFSLIPNRRGLLHYYLEYLFQAQKYLKDRMAALYEEEQPNRTLN